MKPTNMSKLDWDFIVDDHEREWWEAQVWEGFYKILPRFGEKGDYCFTVRFQRDGTNEENRVLGVVGKLSEAYKIAREDATKHGCNSAWMKKKR